MSNQSSPPNAFVGVFKDTGSGLDTIEVLVDDNMKVDIAPFDPGTTDPVVVIGMRLDDSLPAEVQLEATDVEGNVSSCDYSLP